MTLRRLHWSTKLILEARWWVTRLGFAAVKMEGEGWGVFDLRTDKSGRNGVWNFQRTQDPGSDAEAECCGSEAPFLAIWWIASLFEFFLVGGRGGWEELLGVKLVSGKSCRYPIGSRHVAPRPAGPAPTRFFNRGCSSFRAVNGWSNK